MKGHSFIFAALLAATCFTAQAEDKIWNIEIENPSNKAKVDEPVVLDLRQLLGDNSMFRVKSAIVMDEGTEIPSQLDDMNDDLRFDEMAFVINLPAKSKKTVSVTLSSENSAKQYKPRTYAEILLRTSKKDKYVKGFSVFADGKADTYNILHHHGVAFESELVAWRIYFNEKQTTDLYGKFNKQLEIEESMFYPTDEQLKRGFGDDVILVRNSCGAGTLKGWNGTQATHISPVMVRGQRVIASGPVRAIVEAEVKGWEYQGKMLNMKNRYTIYAGHRDAQVDVIFDRPISDETFCTGVQNIAGNAEHFSDHKGLVASWGTDWPVKDTVKYKKETVGLATFIPKKHVIKEATDAENFLYVIHAPKATSFRYYTMFTSRKETFGYPTASAWFEYAKQWKESLEKPIKISITSKSKL